MEDGLQEKGGPAAFQCSLAPPAAATKSWQWSINSVRNAILCDGNVDCLELVELYAGYFKDYPREIVPEGCKEAEDNDVEEKKVKECGEGGEGKDTKREEKERVRMELFSAFPIPVVEGTKFLSNSALNQNAKSIIYVGHH